MVAMKKYSGILILETLMSKELYQILMSGSINRITSVMCFETMFNVNNLDWATIFTIHICVF